MKLLILSDIHGNLSALQAVLSAAASYKAHGANLHGALLLGDHIDYGMRPNEVIAILRELPVPALVKLWGNHEKAVMDAEAYAADAQCAELGLTETSRFSSARGAAFSEFTRTILTPESKRYITEEMETAGWAERTFDGKRFLLIHGSREDVFWKSISPETDAAPYADYDYVVCGHSHRPFCFEKYFSVDDPAVRNLKKTVFVNPGSVGQPRNRQNKACFAVLDTEDGSVHLNAAAYDIAAEQELYDNRVDVFYKTRLQWGI